VPLTLSELTGPGPVVSAVTPEDADLTRNAGTGGEALGQRIIVTGRVLDEWGAPVPHTLIEVWQANACGRYTHRNDQWPGPLDPAFSGFGRVGTNDEGAFWFETIKPGAVPFVAGQMQAPHICVAVFARGLLNHLLTRLYFADDPATAADPILGRVPAERRGTLLAQPGAEAGSYTFDIILQGAGETVFFNL
jgi:protocatechuate 3,4-dioxygenase beta subunit